MAFRLRREEPVPLGLRRIIEEQFSSAIAHLAGPLQSRQQAVHETRKSFKRIRSLLRMLRDDMPDVFAQENARIRDLSAVLGPYRDADAMLETLEHLHQAFPELLDTSMYAAAHTALEDAREKVLQSGDGYTHDAQKVIRQLLDAKQNLPSWRFPDDLEHILPVMRSAFKRARKAGKKARHTQHIEDFHRWRKRVKDLQYQTQLLQDTPAGVTDDFRQELKSLAQLLGNHHDLSILQALLGNAEIFTDQHHAAQVLPLVKQRRKQLEQQAQETGTPLFAQPAKQVFPPDTAT